MKNRKQTGINTVSYSKFDILSPLYHRSGMDISLQNGTNYSQMYFFCNKAVLEYHHVGNGEYADNRYEKARVIREQSSYISYSMNRYQVHPYLLYKGIRHHTPCESEGAFL